MEIGLGLQSDKAVGEYAHIGRIAEDHGFDVISVFADLLYQPPIAALLEIAQATDRVRLGAACWNPFTMHPYEIAGQALALDQASQGRAYIGLARGSWMDTIRVRQDRPVQAIEEAIAVIKALTSGDDRGVDGDIFGLETDTSLRYPRFRDEMPVLIGTWGPRLAAVAGQVADEVKIGGTANPAMVAVMTKRIAAAAGRSVGIVIGAVTVVDEDAEFARSLARTEVAMYIDVVGRLDPTLDLPPGLLDEIHSLVQVGDSNAAGQLISDDILDMFAFAGSPEQVASQAQRLIDAGVQRVEFGTPHGRTGTSGIELLGSRVLPLLRR
ncbi:MAG: LLM class flavin-dependent oxidoreductase [Antricoccus sp.]